MDAHGQAFKEEAFELLAELESSLLEWEQRPDDPDLTGRIFRAMHTIKGSGAMFGFDDIAKFTHEVETAMDMVRNNELAVDTELVSLILQARDHIQAMLEASDGGPAVADETTRTLVAAFRAITAPADRDAAAEGLVEESPSAEAASGGEEISYRIRFKPHPDVFRTGADPVMLLEELRDLGSMRVIAHTDEIPSLEDIDPESCYTYWDIILTSTRGMDAVRDVFIFVEDDSDLKIEIIDDAGLDEEEDNNRLGEILVRRGDLKPEVIDRVIESRPLIGRMLVDAGVVRDETVEAALAEQQHAREARARRQKRESISSIRVPADRLDKLVDLVGELVTLQARLTQSSARLADEELRSISEEAERLTAELRDNAMSTRMVPIETLFGKFRRLVRDLSQELGKDVEMVLSGEETELDKTVIERLNDPLIHLIRNSLDHGIESPEVRKAAGKPATGTLRISAVHSGASVLIRIQDDGAGMDVNRIRAKAVEKGLIIPEAEFAESQIFDLVFLPGFSTAHEVTGVSGRGVGMDVVRKNIEALKGTIELSSQKGRGTEIVLKLPLTLAIIDGLLVGIGGDYFIIPVSIIEECVELTPDQTARAHGRSFVVVRDEMVPYIRLRDRFGINGQVSEVEKVVISEVDGQRLGLVVDRVIGDHQTVIRSLGKLLRYVEEISGATILGDGSVALILDVQRILRAVEQEQAGSEFQKAGKEE